ncbi:MAG TPA: ribonuclease H-like domain-containing protein [Polyangium sp.]|nr:ribonuclease H-like domain-containing protein [Polyangium sp.]
MASFASKLSRLPKMPGEAPSVELAVPKIAPGPESPAEAALRSKPTLDELRNRISRIVAKVSAPAPRPNPTATELPFYLERTDVGPLYVRREKAVPAARVGRVPLVSARDADPAMLSLLALDPALATCDVRKALFLDTETTGLQGGTGTVPFLLGMAFYDANHGGFVLEQALLRRLGEEAPILELATRRLEEASMIITYNGKSFDMPLLRTRFIMNRLPVPADKPHLDLVHVARRIHGQRLKNRTLVNIENEVLGRERVGDVAGADVVACYMHYLRTGDDSALSGVVEHNAADVLSMVALVGLYGEPLGSLGGADLAGVAKTLRRAGQLERAAEMADAALDKGGGSIARRARGDIAKARGDKARALLDYEVLATEVDDPSVRLELAKLYEHHVKAFTSALALVEQGTGETNLDLEKRKARLARKIERSA